METVIVDDWNPAVVYAGNSWTLGGSQVEWNSTTHGSNTPGSGFSITFHGTSISVYGTIGPNATVSGPLRSTYTLENGSSTYTASSTPDVQYHQLFYKSPDVPDGMHALQVTIDDAGPSRTYFLDYITYDIIAASNATSSVAPSSTSPSITPTQSLQSSSVNNGPQIGVLVPAIVVPVCVTLLFVLACVWWLLRRHSRDAGHVESSQPPPPDVRTRGPEHITPFYPASGAAASTTLRGNQSGVGTWEGNASTAWSPYDDARTRTISGALMTNDSSSRIGTSPTGPQLPYGSGRGPSSETGSIKSDIPPSYASNY